MRTLQQNKQKLHYALLIGEQPVYELDDEGNKIIAYIDDEGNIYYQETGETELLYSEPVPFENGISGKLSEVLIESFGINDTSMYAEMDYMANEYPFKNGTLIWKKSEIGYKDAEKTRIDPTTADYMVAGILDEYPNQWSCLLRRILK